MIRITTLITLILVLNINGQNISLDTNFDTNGIKKISVNGEVDNLDFFDFDNNTFLIFSKIYYASSAIENLIYKLNTDGSLDNSFGTSGKLILPAYSSSFRIYKQSNNKILVAFSYVLSMGQPNNQQAILRYNPNGSLDTTFGINGELRVDIINGINSSEFGNDQLILMSDNSFLISDTQRFIKYTADGTIDNTYGTNGVINANNLGNMTNSFDGNLFFYNSLNIEKMDYDGNFINLFGTNGSYSFPTQNYYLLKTNIAKTSFMELENIPTKFYDLNSNGTLNNNFNSVGSIDLTTDNNSLEYYNNFTYENGIFYFVGYTATENPFIVCYDETGKIIKLNNLESYKESLISSGSYTSIMIKDNYLYVCGDEFNTTNNEWSFIVAKYNFSTLSTEQFEYKNKMTYQNPIGNELKINSGDKIEAIEIYNLVGKKVLFSDTNLVDTSCLEEGVYLATVKFKNNKQQTIKILKK